MTSFDKPYYLTLDKMGRDAFAALRDGMKRSEVAAIARAVLFRRTRTVLIRPHGKGLIATTLNYDCSPTTRNGMESAFDTRFVELPALKWA